MRFRGNASPSYGTSGPYELLQAKPVSRDRVLLDRIGCTCAIAVRGGGRVYVWPEMENSDLLIEQLRARTR